MASKAARVMIVDDSAVIRGIVHRLIEAEDDLSVVASVGDGRQALLAAERTRPDIVVLDIEMPVLNGLEALPRLLSMNPDVTVVVASNLTQRNAELSLRALSLGATDYVPKPNGTDNNWGRDDFSRELISKLRIYGARRRRQGLPDAPTEERQIALAPASSKGPRRSVKAFAIGSSTGGPQALTNVLSTMGRLSVPVFITQHMPAAFTKTLAEHLSRQCGQTVVEAEDGQLVRSATVYIAPGGRHMLVRGSSQPVIELSDAPPENFSRPAVDPMLRSLSTVYGDGLRVVILTGMGSDGLLGCRQVVSHGGIVAAQDEATSVVWGMPGAVARAGICSEILPISRIGAWFRSSLTEEVAA